MFVLGSLILLAVALLVAWVLLTLGDAPADLDMGLGPIDYQASPLMLFGAGAAAMLLLALGTWLFVKGYRRRAAKAREIQELRAQAASVVREARQDVAAEADAAARTRALPEREEARRDRVLAQELAAEPGAEIIDRRTVVDDDRRSSTPVTRRVQETRTTSTSPADDDELEYRPGMFGD